MERRLTDFFQVRGTNWRDTLKVRVNLLIYAILRLAFLRRGLFQTHSHLHWTRFPFDLEGATLWNPWLRAWADVMSFVW